MKKGTIMLDKDKIRELLIDDVHSDVDARVILNKI